jgi:hypothetical protein
MVVKRKIPSPCQDLNTQSSSLYSLEKRVVRRIFGCKREEGAQDWRRLHNEELHNLYASTNSIWMIKSQMMRQAGM